MGEFKLEYISGKELMERWSIDFTRLVQLPFPSYDRDLDEMGLDLNPEYEIGSCSGPEIRRFFYIDKGLPANEEEAKERCYKITDIENFEAKYPEYVNTEINETEKKELKRLRKQADETDKALTAALMAGMDLLSKCLSTGYKLAKKDFESYLENDKQIKLTQIMFNKVWQAIPEGLRNDTSGRQRQKIDL